MVTENDSVRLDRLESRFEIRELITDYCIATDDRDMEQLRSLFTDDVRFLSDSVGMDAKGADDAIDMFNNLFKIRGPSYHWTHDVILKFDPDNPDIASGVVLSHAETTPNGCPSIAGIRYYDQYRRVHHQWKFAERNLQFVYYMPMAQFIEHFPTKERIGVNNEWRHADLPEGLASWAEWHRQFPDVEGQ